MRIKESLRGSLQVVCNDSVQKFYLNDFKLIIRYIDYK